MIIPGAVRPALISTIALAAVLQDGSAQATEYRRSAADTLRYREAGETVNTMRGRGGDFSAINQHHALVAVTFGTGNSAMAWYDSVALESTSPRGTFEPNTAPVLGEHFHLLFDARGRVETLSTPDFPESFSAITDLSTQFDDFFVRLPEAELEIGLAWADTVIRGDSASAESWSRLRSEWELHVSRDTVVDDMPGLVIESLQKIATSSVGPVEGENFLLRSELSGEERSVMIFLTEAGRMTSRDDTGELKGTMEMTQGSNVVRLAHEYRYTNSIRAVN